jgi:hypothetical protein
MRKFFNSTFYTEMACDKNQTYLQVRWVRDWTHLPASMFIIEPESPSLKGKRDDHDAICAAAGYFAWAK